VQIKIEITIFEICSDSSFIASVSDLKKSASQLTAHHQEQERRWTQAQLKIYCEPDKETDHPIFREFQILKTEYILSRFLKN